MNIIGANLGLKRPIASHPCMTKVIARPIPLRSWYLNDYIVSCGVGMVLYIFWRVVYSLCILKKKGTQYFTLQDFKEFDNLHDHILVFLIMMLLLYNLGQIIWMAVLYQINYYEDYLWYWKSVIISGYLSLFISITTLQIQSLHHCINLLLEFVAMVMIFSWIGYQMCNKLVWTLYSWNPFD